MPADEHKQNGSSAQSYGAGDDYDELLNPLPEEQKPRATNRTRAAARPYRPPYEKPTRRPADEREDSFNALAWIVEGATGFVEELRRNDLGLSEEFWVHAAAARREGLLAARALLDQWLEETQQQQTEQRAREERQARRGGINVDF
jgi:hypothetical protein